MWNDHGRILHGSDLFDKEQSSFLLSAGATPSLSMMKKGRMPAAPSVPSLRPAVGRLETRCDSLQRQQGYIWIPIERMKPGAPDNSFPPPLEPTPPNVSIIEGVHQLVDYQDGKRQGFCLFDILSVRLSVE